MPRFSVMNKMDNITVAIIILVLVTLDVSYAAFIIHSKSCVVERSFVSLQRQRRTAGIMSMKPEFEGASGNIQDCSLQYTGDQEKETLRIAFGAGKGKHAAKRRRRHTNKYSSKSKAVKLDPWEQQLRLAEEISGESKARERLEIEEREARRIQRRIERGDVIYPDEEDIDPYDPSSFGYIEVGHVLGAHGVKGEVKVRSSTDFAVNRLCTPGAKHIKAPNRRFPRDIELICGRLQKEDIFLLQLEGISTREAAAALRGHKIYALETEEVNLDSDEYMVRDIVGARAYRADDESVYLGEVVGAVLGDDISGGLASDMLELRLPSENPTDVPKLCYIPFVSAFVPAVRLNAGSNSTVLLDLPEGLLDLAVQAEDKVTIKGLLPG